MTRTTPPRPVDAAAVLPQLASLARTATRLHPRPGSPTALDSSVGGPLLWPAGQAWPYCEGPHVDRRRRPKPAVSPTDVRLQRRVKAAALSRPHRDPRFPEYTPEELEINKRAAAGRPWPEGPVAMLAVAQLYTRDVPLLRPPGQADLLQVLWCPFDHHPLQPYPGTALFWRSAAEVTNILADPPEPAAAQHPWYVPEPCLLHPEQITEYPSLMDLSRDLRELLKQQSTWQAAGITLDGSYAIAPQGFYSSKLSVAPGWKAGGWPIWGLTDPIPRSCPACGTGMTPLLAIDSAEWDDSTRGWIPYEDQDHAGSGTYPDLRHPTMIHIADDNTLQLYACPESPDHPHVALLQ